MAKKHAKKSENFNEDLLRYIMDSVYYTGEGEGDDEDAGVRPESYRPLLADAKTYREGRNRLIKKIQDDGNIDFLLPAIEAYNYDYGNPEAGIVYGPESFDATKLKKEPIDVRSMDLADVDAVSSAIADFLGMNDNGDKERGKLDALLKAYYAGEKNALQNLADAHAGDYDLYRESRALSDALRGKIETNHAEKARLYRMLGITPDTDIEEVLNIDRGLPAYAQRSYRAYARTKDTPAKAVSLLEGMLVAPQVAEKWDQGKTPTLVDVGSDIAETAALGALKFGKPVVKALTHAGSVSALDLLHDAADDAMSEKVYSQGEYPDSGKDYSDLADGSRLGGLVAGLGLNSVIRGVSPVIARKLDNTLNKSAEKAEKKVQSLQKKAADVQKQASETLFDIEKRKQDIVAKMEDKKSALAALNASRKAAKKDKVSMKEFEQSLRNDLSDANIDQTEVENSARKTIAQLHKNMRDTRQKNALMQLFGTVPTERMLYNSYSRNRAIDAIDEIRGATRPR